MFDKAIQHKPFSSHRKEKRNGGLHSDRQQRESSKQERSPPREDSPQRSEYSQQRDVLPHTQWNYPIPAPAAPPIGVPLPPGQLPPGPLPPPPGRPQRGQLPRQRSYSDSRDDRDDKRYAPNSRYVSDSESDLDDRRPPRSMYSSNAPDRRRDTDWRDGGYERTAEERQYYRPNGGTAQQMIVGSRDTNRNQGALVVSFGTTTTVLC